MQESLKTLIQDGQADILKLLRSLPIDEELLALSFEDIESMNIDEVLNGIYLMYPRLFSSLFFKDGQNKEQQLTKLCIAGFFIYRFVVKSDAVFDRNSQTFNNADLLSAFAYQEEGVRLLSTLFDYDASFWKIWNRRKRELAQAVALDNNIEELDWDLYEILADCKSTFGKVAIDAVYLINGDRTLNAAYQKLLDSHRYFSVGFQILDDVQDFERDLSIGQTNIGLLCLADQLAIPYRSLFLKEDKEALHKLFKDKELDVFLLDKAAEYFDKSKAEVATYQSQIPYWMEIIDLKKSQVLQLKA